MLSKENGSEDVQLVMGKDIVFPNALEVLYLTGNTDYYDPELEDEESIDVLVRDLESRWAYIDTALVEVGSEDGYLIESFTLEDLLNNKLYMTTLHWSQWDGYNRNIELNLEWKEAEEVTKQVTFYKPKDSELYGTYIYVNGAD